MSVSSKRAAVLWTGGKDCNLALYEAQQAGYEIVALVTFMMGNGKFKAHPIDVMRLQAEALGIPYITIPVAEPRISEYWVLNIFSTLSIAKMFLVMSYEAKASNRV